MSWIHDHCEVDWFDYLPNPGWARGILSLHATCTPPCPRKQMAAEYLAELETPTSDVDGETPPT